MAETDDVLEPGDTSQAEWLKINEPKAQPASLAPELPKPGDAVDGVLENIGKFGAPVLATVAIADEAVEAAGRLKQVLGGRRKEGEPEEHFDWEKNEAKLLKIVDKEKGGRPFSSSRAAELTDERDTYWEEHKVEHITAEDKKAVGNLIDDQVKRYDSDGLVPGTKSDDPLQLFLEDVDRKIEVYTNGSQKDPIKASWWRGVRINVEQRCLKAELSLRAKIPGGEAEEVEERIKELGIELKYLVWGGNKEATRSRWSQLAARYAQWLMDNDSSLKAGAETMRQAEAAARVQQTPIAPGFNPSDLKEMFGSGATYKDFIRRILNQDGHHTTWTDFPPPWYKNLPDDLKTQAELYETLANGAYVKKSSGQVKLEPVQNNEALRMLDVRDLRKFYESAGGREALQTLMGKYFELYADDFGYKWVRLKGYGKSRYGDKKEYEETRVAITNASALDGFKKETWEKIKGLSGVVNEAKRMGLQDEGGAEIVAKGKVANAWNFIYNSHVVEAADVDRFLPPGAPSYVEQVRAEFHPLSKIKAKMKITGDGDPGLEREAWGGAVGAWLAEHATDRDLRRKVESGEIRPYPETLFASMLELIGEENGASLAESLITKNEINWGEIKPQELIGYYGDLWSAATSLYTYATAPDSAQGKTQAGDNNLKWKAWGVDLANSFAKLRKTPVGVYCSDEEALFWMVANSLPVNIKSRNLSISGKEYPDLDIAIKNMLGERLRYTKFDPKTRTFREDQQVVGRIQARIGATIVRSFFSGIK